MATRARHGRLDRTHRTPGGGGGARVCYPRSWKGRHRASSDRHFEGMPRHTNNTTRPSGAGRGFLGGRRLYMQINYLHTMCLCGHTYGHFRRRSHIATARGSPVGLHMDIGSSGAPRNDPAVLLCAFSDPGRRGCTPSKCLSEDARWRPFHDRG